MPALLSCHAPGLYRQDRAGREAPHWSKESWVFKMKRIIFLIDCR
jgi:hypothetical protein